MEEKNRMNMHSESVEMPDTTGYFGEYGGSFVPPQIQKVLDEITEAYGKIKDDESFKEEISSLYKDYVGRPSPIFYAKSLSEKCGGARIYLKREDLNHTGAHKINHCLGEALLAKKMGKKKLSRRRGGSAWSCACDGRRLCGT